MKEVQGLFVTLPIAERLKQIGFNEPCFARYSHKQFQFNTLGKPLYHNAGEIEKHYIGAPTYDEAINWLDNKLKIRIEVETIMNGKVKGTIHKWNFDNNIGHWERIGFIKSHDSFQEAKVELLSIALEILKNEDPEISIKRNAALRNK